MNSPPTLETDRLVLRPFKIADANRVQELAGVVEVYRTTLNVPHPYEDGVAERWIASHASVFDDGRGVNFAMTLKPDGTLIGSISLEVTPAHRKGELGYWVGVPYWGNGYCTEAARATVRYGFDTLGLHKVTSRHMVHNVASGWVMEKVRMTREGLLRDELWKDGQVYDLVVYGLLASDARSVGRGTGTAGNWSGSNR